MNLSEVKHRAGNAAAAATVIATAVAAATANTITNATAATVTATTVAATLGTVESFGIGYGQGAGANADDWMKPPGDLFLYCDMKDLTGAVGDMVSYKYFPRCSVFH